MKNREGQRFEPVILHKRKGPLRRQGAQGKAKSGKAGPWRRAAARVAVRYRHCQPSPEREEAAKAVQ